METAKPVRGKIYAHKDKGKCQLISDHPDDGACLIMEESDRDDGEICHFFISESSQLTEIEPLPKQEAVQPVECAPLRSLEEMQVYVMQIRKVLTNDNAEAIHALEEICIQMNMQARQPKRGSIQDALDIAMSYKTAEPIKREASEEMQLLGWVFDRLYLGLHSKQENFDLKLVMGRISEVVGADFRKRNQIENGQP